MSGLPVLASPAAASGQHRPGRKRKAVENSCNEGGKPNIGGVWTGIRPGHSFGENSAPRTVLPPRLGPFFHTTRLKTAIRDDGPFHPAASLILAFSASVSASVRCRTHHWACGR